MEFSIVKRQALIVWLYTLKHLKTIRKYGSLHYVSDRLKYAVLYVEQDKQEEIIKILDKYHFVRKIEVSYRDDIDMTFKDAIPNRIDPDLAPKNEEEEQQSNFIKSLAQTLEVTKKMGNE
ncbi:YlbG family protein [Aerococcaceae bacterium NML210727]|nr:YlbG family protein [Aerococcaceae bacterium NML210727]MCW6654247.1 YlbG family protein [Aerococcaceae bacterium NML201296]MCW6661020.1 YlbG family protein [Aerococcaceae bacterium NML201209]MCW6663589.1 YlbG family protein [Aerococcaceae bacterium NML190073]MCW6664078.1 YlbG family protein [Aerococcaceae bacterium NML191219]MCW6679612.1 YlbG family protein [Aerococcaceae bacterium NML130460]